MSDWDVFGSDSDEDEIVEEQNNIDNPTTTTTTTISSSRNTLQAKINVSLEKSTDAIITFSIQKLIKTNRSVKLPQRYFGIVENQEVVQHNTQDEKTYEIMNAWNNNMCSKIQQRGMKLVNVNHQKNESGHSLFDVASIGRIFTVDIPSQKLIDYDLGAEAETIESSIRKDLVAGGLLLVTMVIKAEKIDMNNEEWTAQSLLQQWKTGIQDNTVFTKAVWDIETASIIYSDSTIKADSSFAEVYTISLTKRPCTVNTLSCPWKTNHKKVPTSFYDESKNNKMDESWIDYERRILSSATISQSIHEQNEGLLTADNIEKAVKALQTHGFVILPGLFREQSNLEMVQSWSNAVLQDFDRAAIILKEKNNVDILNPGEGLDPISYREMAMREDLRVDLRDGPAMKEFRTSIEQSDKKALQNLQYKIIDGGDGTTPIIIDKNQSSSFINENQTHSLPTPSLRFNPFVLEIIRKLQNPQSSDSENHQDQTPPLYKGNFGRWNFSGSGPNGSAQPVRVGHIGSVISLPGSADQCIHADTPHIFEIYDRLPCHYANLFIMGKDMNASNNNSVDNDGNFTGENLVGGTAFIDGSHHLSVTARLTEDKGISAAGVDNSTQNEMHMRIIRPSLRTGDALLFDTRTLHFGLANNSERIRRPLLYVNMTHSWFFDPKNWDNKQSIFE